ncbi:MAG: hypothetical protein BWZ01_02305 [Deltaproteobacteria bacterium ADurb.BinA179]|nr:MAG: hypothetical protein BWZ01_02305 [Deltaproteobacteria bacterium ADurb.BinA179]
MAYDYILSGKVSEIHDIDAGLFCIESRVIPDIAGDDGVALLLERLTEIIHPASRAGAYLPHRPAGIHQPYCFERQPAGPGRKIFFFPKNPNS